MAASDIIYLIIAGCIGGFFSGMLGVGGGVIFVPILDYFLTKYGAIENDLVSYTLANSFFAILISGFVGSYSAFKSKSIHLIHLFSVAFSGIFFILIISYLINIGTWYTPLVFKLVFCGMLVFALLKTIMHIEIHGTEEKMNTGMGLFIGMTAGITSGLSGLGGGFVMVPLFMILGKMTIRKASVLSLAVIPLLVLPNVIYYALHQPEQSISGSTGFLAWPIIIPLILGVMMTVKLGVKAANRMSPKTIKAIFAAFMIITIIKTLASVI